MEISEVRIKLVAESTERLRAFCSITLDGDFVIRDLKIIDGVSGPFVAMPSRKLADRCPRCGCKNHLRAKFCNDCGVKLNENRAPKDSMGRAKLHADVAHPINAACRERIQAAVVKAYEVEVEKAKSPDYKPPVYDDFGDDDVAHLVEEQPRPVAAAPPKERPPTVEEGGDDEGNFSDYSSLIADLKREAADRGGRSERHYSELPELAPQEDRPERGNERTNDRGNEGGGQRDMRQGRGENRGDRGGQRPGREDRGPRRFDRRDDRRGGPPRDDRQRDQMSRPEPPAAPPASEPVKASPPPPPPPPPSEEDDFGAGL